MKSLSIPKYKAKPNPIIKRKVPIAPKKCIGFFPNLPINTTVSKSSPVQVVGGFTDWCQISAGGFFGNAERHSLAVRQNGTAWAWGYGGGGVLGDGTTVDKSSPVSVVGGFTDWCQVAAGYGISAGIRTTAT